MAYTAAQSDVISLSQTYTHNFKYIRKHLSELHTCDIRYANIIYPTVRSTQPTAEFLTPHLLINTWQELEYRLDICRATKGAHIEVYGRA